MARIKDLNFGMPDGTDAFVYDGAGGTKKVTFSELRESLIVDELSTSTSAAPSARLHKVVNDSLFDNTAVTFTMQEHCTLTRGGAWRVGNTIFVNCVIAVDEQLASNTNLVRISNWAIPSATADLIARLGTSAYPVYVSSGGYIRCSGTWAAGDYIIIGAYPISG